MATLKGSDHLSQNPICCFCLHTDHCDLKSHDRSKTSTNSLFVVPLRPVSDFLFMHLLYVELMILVILFPPWPPRLVLVHYNGITIQKQNGTVESTIKTDHFIKCLQFHFTVWPWMVPHRCRLFRHNSGTSMASKMAARYLEQKGFWDGWAGPFNAIKIDSKEPKARRFAMTSSVNHK